MNRQPAWIIGQGRLVVAMGDLTLAEHEAIVNAANSSLLGGGGVDGAIHRAAGPELLAACKAIVAKRGPLPPGQAVITPGFRLKARWVIHTVGPIWHGGGHDEERLLASAYDASLALAAEHGLSNVAFPAISCGAYGYPLDSAASVAVGRLSAGIAAGLVCEAAMILFSEAAHDAFVTAAKTLLGDPPLENA
ncbi:Appr-1-p processing domain protein [Alkalidesulfovibrio alkalitolerans DSM 16529]|jgi:O-acetyl-ADP-ribose deacetylase (regulator of RNase III)|uniref:Appr-1-p processing domain protein n=1 Tax=Alkalidesulfovibrio alkalitolerans DSM 16529 TaxID=1121439 RepID=S7T331_9BACT|nr:O-acetyl-ADP-ribose deacetylase [Alkalidesulfovibrio alkalitolerans]EPR31492.1 Appr-1-p processing domain protein [Alkalidesulfovibrio alkalitolerans DSM 16529]